MLARREGEGAFGRGPAGEGRLGRGTAPPTEAPRLASRSRRLAIESEAGGGESKGDSLRPLPTWTPGLFLTLAGLEINGKATVRLFVAQRISEILAVEEAQQISATLLAKGGGSTLDL